VKTKLNFVLSRGTFRCSFCISQLNVALVAKQFLLRTSCALSLSPLSPLPSPSLHVWLGPAYLKSKFFPPLCISQFHLELFLNVPHVTWRILSTPFIQSPANESSLALLHACFSCSLAFGVSIVVFIFYFYLLFIFSCKGGVSSAHMPQATYLEPGPIIDY